MTKAELIRRLNNAPDDAEVFVWSANFSVLDAEEWPECLGGNNIQVDVVREGSEPARIEIYTNVNA